MSATTLLAFAGVALLCVAKPGPTMLLALRSGARHGWRAALPGMAGALASDVLRMVAAAAGLSALLAASAWAFAGVKWLGVAYLAWLGLQLWRGSAAPACRWPPPARPARRRSFLQSFLVAVSSPKGYLFFAALLLQFVDPAQAPLAQYGLLALVFTGLDLAAPGAYAAAGERALRCLGGPSAGRWLDRTCGTALPLLAAGLALLRRTAGSARAPGPAPPQQAAARRTRACGAEQTRPGAARMLEAACR
jgi:threonine/homoserine/homoserine lactone efflux protein